MNMIDEETLEICLRKLAAGIPLEEILAEYPRQAFELRELLMAAQLAIPAGSAIRVPASAQVNSRRRFLEQARQLKQRQRKGIWPLLRFLRYNLGSVAFATAALVLLFVGFGSLRSLPGDRLYPVKLYAEQAEVSLSNQPGTRLELETSFDVRRAQEVTAMIQLRRIGMVRFAGFLKSSPKGDWSVSGVPTEWTNDNLPLAHQYVGAYVQLTGFLNARGVVQVQSVEPSLVSVSGILKSIAANGWQVDDLFVEVRPETQVNGVPKVGSRVTLEAARTEQALSVVAISVNIEGEPTSTHSISPTATASATPEPSMTPRLRETEEPEIKVTATGEPEENKPVVKPSETHTAEDEHSPELTPSPESHSEEHPSTPVPEPTDNHESGKD